MLIYAIFNINVTDNEHAGCSFVSFYLSIMIGQKGPDNFIKQKSLHKNTSN